MPSVISWCARTGSKHCISFTMTGASPNAGAIASMASSTHSVTFLMYCRLFGFGFVMSKAAIV